MEIIYLILLFVLLYFNQASGCTFLKLDEGVIKGRVASIPNEQKTFYSFQQIPYAAPPIGNLRFQPPTPVSKWEGILDCTRNTKICYQIATDSVTETEDCLYLNVYTPELPSDQNKVSLPVMVYIHGGAFSNGDGTLRSFGPDFLIPHDVVIVTLNYRLGVFGFLSTLDTVIPGNNGLKDQLFALQWINNNIHLFGGDPSRITIAGQSAGAASVGYHLLSKKSAGLYRGAILESSSAICPFAFQRDAKNFAIKIASYIDSSVDETVTSQQILDVMLKASAKEIDQGAKNITNQENYDNVQLFQGYFYAPAIEPEHEGAFLTERMFEVLNKGEASRVPLLMGVNSEESLSQTTDLVFMSRLMSLYDNDLKALVPKDMNIESDDIRNQAGERIRQIYSGTDLLQNIPAAGLRYWSDTTFTRPVIKHASIQAQYSDVFFYQFSYDGRIGNITIIVNGTEKVGHNEENPYLWRIRNEMFDNNDLSLFPDTDLIAQKRLTTMWTNFVKELNPTPEKISLLQNVTWPTVSSTDDFPYLDIGEDLEVKYHPKEESFSGWEAIYKEFGKAPYDTY